MPSTGPRHVHNNGSLEDLFFTTQTVGEAMWGYNDTFIQDLIQGRSTAVLRL
jgi:hypothetical protein